MAALTAGLLDDEAVAAGVPLADAVAAHLDAAATGVQGVFVVGDDQLAAVGRGVRDGRIRVCAVSTSGAGSLLALGRREIAGVEVVAARTTLRDLDDLAQNAARVVAAAAALDDIEVRVGLPYAPGWILAAELLEAAGLYAAVGLPATATSIEELAEQLSTLVELDLPFTVSGPVGPAAFLAAVDVLIDGAGAVEAADLLRTGRADRLADVVAREDAAVAARVRRRVRAIGCPDVTTAAAELRRS